MENSIYLGLSRQMVLKTNLDIVANNIANMNTAGFRSQEPLFEEYISDPARGDDPLSFVYDYGQYQNTLPGPQQQTGNIYNVALNGPGWLTVQGPTGETVYTRDGNFQRSADGTLLTAGGFPVLSSSGPINIPANSTEVVIDEKGTITNQNGILGHLSVVEFENQQVLDPVGNNLYRSNVAGNTAKETTVHQGFLEGSNVNPVMETNRMIQILRDYQSIQKMLENEHERLRSTIQKLTQV